MTRGGNEKPELTPRLISLLQEIDGGTRCNLTDRGVPSSPAAFAPLVGTLVRQLRSGESVANHCRAGIGRSGLLAGCVLGSVGVDQVSFDIMRAP